MLERPQYASPNGLTEKQPSANSEHENRKREQKNEEKLPRWPRERVPTERAPLCPVRSRRRSVCRRRGHRINRASQKLHSSSAARFGTRSVRERENRRTWRSDLGSRNTVMPGKITVYAAQVAHRRTKKLCQLQLPRTRDVL